MSASDDKKKKRKKERESVLMKEIEKIMQASLKQCLDQALNDLFKGFGK